MINYRPGDIILVSFPFSAGGAATKRPALVILDTGDMDVLLARITGQSYSTAHDVPISDWKGAGLIKPSVIRLHKLATIEKKTIQGQLGILQPRDRAAVALVLQKTYGSW
jgi:mRNA interferase MazF